MEKWKSLILEAYLMDVSWLLIVHQKYDQVTYSSDGVHLFQPKVFMVDSSWNMDT